MGTKDMGTNGYTVLGWLFWQIGSRMGPRGYTFLGWAVWQTCSRLAKRSIAQNQAKLGAIGAIALVLIGGVLAAKADED